MRRAVLAGIGAVVVVAAGAVAVWAATADDPVATGRSGDACTGPGSAGLVGFDEETGAVRWTNVVGDSVSRVWAGSAPVDGTAHVVVVGEDASVRTVVAATGAVDRCPDASKPRTEDLPVATTVDASGATARDRTAGAVDVVEVDGTRRWLVDGRQLVGASAGGVVVRSDIDRGAIEHDCCDGSSPSFSLELLDLEDGHVRWSEEVLGIQAVVTDDHVLVLDQFDGAPRTSGPSASAPPQRGRVTAYSLVDGREVWHARLPGVLGELYAADGTVYVPNGRGEPTLTAIDEQTGRTRWSAPLPEPGRGGDATEYGGTSGLAVADGVVAVVVQSTEPYRD